MPENHPAEPAKVLTVGEVARRSGVAVSTVHFYESKGLIKGWRSEGNQRRYPREVLRHIAVIRVAQRTGIPLETIRDSLSRLPEGASSMPRSGRRCPRTGATSSTHASAC